MAALRELQVGDRVRVNANYASLEGEKLRVGALGTVVDIDHLSYPVAVLLDDPALRPKPMFFDGTCFAHFDAVELDLLDEVVPTEVPD